ncbi:MAG: peroxiredoxin [Flavobacterium sp.]|jgi:peroxiredoxin
MKSISLLLTLVLALPVLAVNPDQHVENFELLDHAGISHELYYLSDAKAIVFMVQGNGCPIVRNALPDLKSLRDTYADQGIEFLMINANIQDNRTTIAKEAEEYNINIPILVDETQLIGESLGLVRTGEVFVIDPKTWSVVYTGPLNDRLTYESQKATTKHHYLKDALDDLLANETVKVTSADPVGCLINMPENAEKSRVAHQQISYSETIAPIIYKNCVTCHRAGGMGPFAMSSYLVIKGFSPMIREVLRTKRMPPWHADPHYGEFANDRSLSTQQIQNMVHWIEAGSPRGTGPDLLAQDDRDWPKYRMGTPDFVIDIPATDVPATGVVDYQYKMVDNPLDEDVWVSGTEVIPGDYQALHHVIGMYGKINPDAEPRRRFVPMGGMGGYAPGTDAGFYPDNSGTFLPKDAKFSFQMHYTSFGKAVIDKTQVGVWLHKEKPKNIMQGQFIANYQIKIPANTKRHTESKEYTFEREALLYSVLPHSHFRGIASDFVAIYPDGSSEMLLSVPNYDFNWQTDYTFKEPKVLPAGTKIMHTTTYDNSSQNSSNPDSTIEVTWGEQTFQEMLFASFSFRYLDDASVDEASIANIGSE